MSRPVEYFIFDPGFPEIIISSATPRVEAFCMGTAPKRRAKSQDPGLLRVPKTEIGDMRAKDPGVSRKSLQRSPSTPALAQSIRPNNLENVHKYASKAPWALEGKGPARLDLSLWRSKKSQLPNEVITASSVSTDKPSEIKPKKSIVTVNVQSKHPLPPPPEIPTVTIDANSNAVPKPRSRSFGNGKINREFRLVENTIYHGDLEGAMDVETHLKTGEGGTI